MIDWLDDDGNPIDHSKDGKDGNLKADSKSDAEGYRPGHEDLPQANEKAYEQGVGGLLHNTHYSWMFLRRRLFGQAQGRDQQ